MTRPLLREAAELGALLIGGAIIIVVLGVLALAWADTAAAKMSGMTVAERQEFMNLSPTERAARGEYFRSLKVPGTGASCCDISDCHFVEVRFKDGKWYAPIPFDRVDPPNARVWTAIPPGKVLSGKVSPSEDGKAILCSLFTQIYCFIVPANGY